MYGKSATGYTWGIQSLHDTHAVNICMMYNLAQKWDGIMRTGMNLEYNYKLSSTRGLCKEVILYRSDLCYVVVIEYALIVFGN